MRVDWSIEDRLAATEDGLRDVVRQGASRIGELAGALATSGEVVIPASEFGSAGQVGQGSTFQNLYDAADLVEGGGEGWQT